MLEKQLPYKYRVYEILKKEIMGGKYAPGDVLNERPISEELGVSRTPIREALQMLAQDGWVTVETYKGAVVRRIDVRYIKEISRIRGALEICAMEDAVKRVTDNDISILEDIHRKQVALLDNFEPRGYIRLDRQFHSHIHAMSQNQELNHLLTNYADMFSFLGVHAVLNTLERRSSTLFEHETILEGLRRRDGQAAIDAMKNHMVNTDINLCARLAKVYSDE